MTANASSFCAVRHRQINRLWLGFALLCFADTPTRAQDVPAETGLDGTDSAAATVQVSTAKDDTSLAETPRPVTTRFVWSQFADSVVAGDAASTLRYGGKVDAYIDVKGSAFGLDDSISLQFHPEFRYGESSIGEVGVLPANAQLFYPEDGEVFDLSVSATKRWNSGASLTVGKINVLDLATRVPIQGGGGHDGFQNLALALPPSAIVPASVTGAFLNVPTEKVVFRVLVFDPELTRTLPKSVPSETLTPVAPSMMLS